MNLDNNKLENLPETIGDMEQLRVFYLRENSSLNFDKTFTSLAKCKNLRELWLNWNKIVELPESIGKIKSLTMLNLSVNNIEKLPKGLFELTNLEELLIENNKIRVVPDNISKLKQLKTLSFLGNKLKILPKAIAELKNLKSLDIMANKFPEDEIQNIIKLLPEPQVSFDKKEEKPETEEKPEGIIED